MKAKILIILLAFVFSLFISSCQDNSSQKIDVEKYRENLKKSGQKNSITPEQREKNLKKMFPNYQPKQN